jgi:bifunctional enzyme CysN/CysC
MATGASTADLAVILVDARKGVLTQTRRHAYICSLLGIRHVVLAINKIDLVGFSEEIFNAIVGEFRDFASKLDFASLVAIPLSARFGHNVMERSAALPWYQGPSLLAHLDEVDVASDREALPFRMHVQWVNRPNAAFRGFAGTIASGRLAPGDSVTVAGSGRSTRIARIVTQDGDLPEALAGDAVMLTLEDEVDVSRGDVLAPGHNRPDVSDQFAAHILWMTDEEMLPGRQYLLKAGSRTLPATVTELKHKVDVNSLERFAAKTLQLNEVGFCNLSTAMPLTFDTYRNNRETGSFILIDRYSNATVAGGMIEFGLRRATNVHWQALDVSKQSRADLKGQKPVILWFTGLSGSGKSTIANIVERKLTFAGRHTYLLDGDNVRHGLNRDLGFTDADRVENIRRVAETAKLFVDAGLIVLVSFISPFRSERRTARELVGPEEFLEIHVDTPLEVCMARDPKGLYKRVQRGEVRNFTGIDSPYEVPENPDIRVNTVDLTPEEAADKIIESMRSAGLIA